MKRTLVISLVIGAFLTLAVLRAYSWTNFPVPNGSGSAVRTGINNSLTELGNAVNTKEGLAGFANYSTNQQAKVGAPGGIATLDVNGNVIQFPAAAVGSPTPASIPIADANGTLNNWVTSMPDTMTTFSDNVAGNAGPTMHGWMPKTPGDTGKYLITGFGNYSAFSVAGTNGGTVTSVSWPSANGFSATITDPTVAPVITLNTTPHGILFSNGTGISAAVSGTDYQPPITYVTNALAADVAMTAVNTYYNGPSITLTPGTWTLSGKVQVTTSSGGGAVSAKIWDGASNNNVSGLSRGDVANTSVSIGLCGGPPVTVATSTTFKISCAYNASGTGAKIQAACASNGAGNTASTITAVRIGP